LLLLCCDRVGNKSRLDEGAKEMWYFYVLPKQDLLVTIFPRCFHGPCLTACAGRRNNDDNVTVGKESRAGSQTKSTGVELSNVYIIDFYVIVR